MTLNKASLIILYLHDKVSYVPHFNTIKLPIYIHQKNSYDPHRNIIKNHPLST